MRRSIQSLIVAAVTAGLISSASSSGGSAVRLEDLKATAKVIRDVDGIAHIIAANQHDLFFLQGYVHAQDRLFQMDVSRRTANGTLAELLGQNALENDVLFRTIGLHRAAELSLEVYSRRALRVMEAYTAGVNAYVARYPLPPEYAALELTQFEPWTVLDTANVVKLIGFGLSFDLQDIDRTEALLAYQEAGSEHNFDGTALFFEDLFRFAPFDPASTMPDASIASTEAPEASPLRKPRRGPSAVHAEAARLGKRYLNRARKVPFLKAVLHRDDHPGSNEWAVSGEHTASGLPLMDGQRPTPGASDAVNVLSGPSTCTSF